MDLIFVPSVDKEEYFVATYFLEPTKSLKDAAWCLAIGQSVGNPNVRNKWESDDLFINYSCKIIGDPNELEKHKEGNVDIAFPVVNTDWAEDGVSHLLCQLMGGQMDIDIITKCHLLQVKFPQSIEQHFKGPKYGIDNIREYTNCKDRPLLGAIIKPKTGITPQILLEMVKELVEGGVNFIKEDEILSNPIFCRIEDRVPLVMNYLKQREKEGHDKVVYCVCINADSPYALERVKKVHELGGNGIHINFWSGLGVYKAIRDLDLPIFIHFQKSGDKILTSKTHDYHIDWKVICQLAGMMGVDFIHAGMWGGYMSDNEEELKKVLDILHHYRVMPALSCGMHPGIVNAITKRFGYEFMANCGGAIHGHPMGTKSGARAMKQAIDGKLNETEYKVAIEKFGLLE